jgi:hypothetical protein
MTWTGTATPTTASHPRRQCTPLSRLSPPDSSSFGQPHHTTISLFENSPAPSSLCPPSAPWKTLRIRHATLCCNPSGSFPRASLTFPLRFSLFPKTVHLDGVRECISLSVQARQPATSPHHAPPNGPLHPPALHGAHETERHHTVGEWAVLS